MEQRTESWYKYRRDRIGASEAGAIMGLNPHKTPYDVWLSKQEGYVQEDNEAMKHGREMEPEALSKFEQETKILMSPKVLESKVHPWMMASLDGLDIDEKCAVEIKCPYRVNSHLHVLNGDIPPHYMAQMQHQMYVAELNEIYFCSYFPNHVNPLYIEIIKRDDAFIAKMIEKESAFYHNHILTGIPPENPKAIKTIDSEVWLNLSEEYKRLDRQEKEAQKRKEEIRDYLVQIAQSENAKGNGIILQKVERKGIINYQNIPEFKTIDLEKYRKPSTSYWQVKELNEA